MHRIESAFAVTLSEFTTKHLAMTVSTILSGVTEKKAICVEMNALWPPTAVGGKFLVSYY